MRKAIKWCALLLAFGLIVVVILSLFVTTRTEVEHLASSVSSWQNSLRIVRWSFIAALIIFWTESCDLLGKIKGLDSMQLEIVKAMKWRITAALIAFELLVIESLPAKIIGV